jgi:ketosteroid isomerase-like protein
MDVSRRDLMVAGAMTLGASGLLLSGSASAQAGDEAAVTAAVETLRKGTFEADKAKLDQVTAAQVSYGHSGGRIETKDQFITGVMTRKQVVKSLAFPDLKVAVVGNAAIVRHIWLSESELEGKTTNTKIGVLQVWQKQDGGWKLLARQAFTLPATT